MLRATSIGPPVHTGRGYIVLTPLVHGLIAALDDAETTLPTGIDDT